MKQIDPKNVTLSIVIPCYNEVRNIEILIKRAKIAISVSSGVEFIFVDNGSSDGTEVELERRVQGITGLRTVRVATNRGYGFGIKSGLSVAAGRLVGWTHADVQTDPVDVVTGFKLCEGLGSNIIVKGSRTGRPFAESFWTGAMSILESCLFLTNLRNINSQPTFFGRSLLPAILAGPDDFSLDLFALVAAKRAGYREVRFPVRFVPRLHGHSKWNTSLLARVRFICRELNSSFALARRWEKF